MARPLSTAGGEGYFCLHQRQFRWIGCPVGMPGLARIDNADQEYLPRTLESAKEGQPACAASADGSPALQMGSVRGCRRISDAWRSISGFSRQLSQRRRDLFW